MSSDWQVSVELMIGLGTIDLSNLSCKCSSSVYAVFWSSIEICHGKTNLVFIVKLFCNHLSVRLLLRGESRGKVQKGERNSCRFRFFPSK
jgi:hypothetical protein